MLVLKESTNDLWSQRYDLAGWSKKQTKERAMFFFDAYKEVCEKLDNGFIYRTGDIKRTNLYRHILTLNKRGRKAISKFNWMSGLFYDIKENGILKPILMIDYGDNRKLHTGNHRLVCAYVLGIPMMEVCQITPDEYGKINRKIYSG